MAFMIKRTDAFAGDFEEAVEYLVLELKSPQAAENLIRELKNRSEILEHNPYVYAVSRRPMLGARAIRELLVKNYVAIYVIEGDAVVFLRFFHQTQMFERFFD